MLSRPYGNLGVSLAERAPSIGWVLSFLLCWYGYVSYMQHLVCGPGPQRIVTRLGLLCASTGVRSLFVFAAGSAHAVQRGVACLPPSPCLQHHPL